MIRITRSISRLAVLAVGALLSLGACADSHPEAQSCASNGMMYFQCKAAGKSFTLCDQQPGILLFSVTGGASEVFYSGKIGEAFKFENYHRYKVTQNTLSFSIENADYELFDYIDEEMQPASREIGVTIDSHNGSKQELICGPESKSRLGQFN